jgi:virginiamycin A acetyltransferase
MHRVVVTEETIALLRARRVSTRVGGGDRFRPGDVLGVHPLARLEAYSHLLAGYQVPRALGAFSYSHSPIDYPVSVGRYCSLAGEIFWLGPDHPTEWASTSAFWLGGEALPGVAEYRATAGFAAPPPFERAHVQPTTIGHDVWIANQAAIRPGVAIGHGAVVAARAVVTRDVPPYAIVGGVPAKVIRLRFPEPLVERFLRVGWWDYAPGLFRDAPVEDAAAFLDRVEAAVTTQALQKVAPTVVTAADLIATSAG